MLLERLESEVQVLMPENDLPITFFVIRGESHEEDAIENRDLARAVTQLQIHVFRYCR